MTLFGEEIPALPGFKYNFGYRHLSAGDENGIIAGMVKEAEIGNGVTFGVLGEIAYFDNYGGADDDAVYATLGASLKRGPWHGELTGEIRHLEVEGADHLVQVSAGYGFESGYDLSVGYAFEHVGGIDNQTLGLRLTKCFNFATSGPKPEC